MGGERRRFTVTAVVLVALAAGGLLAGCAGTGLVHHHRSAPARTPAQKRLAAEVAVIRGWSVALLAGHVTQAARYFQLPSAFVNGTELDQGVAITNRRVAVRVNEELPCGAVYVSAMQQGRYVNALFRLTDRKGPGGGVGVCGSGTGQTARVDFLIRGRLIAQWLRAPSQPGDNGAPGTSTTPGGSATSPGTNTVPPGTQTAPPGTQTAPPGTQTAPPSTRTTPTQTGSGTTPTV